jgi:hypothetical protein
VDGNIVSNTVKNHIWGSMWTGSYSTLEVPSIPTEPGEYILEIYFNSMVAHKQSFTVVQ